MHVDIGELSLYCEQGQDQTLPQLLFISGSGGDLRNKPNQFDSPLAQAFRLLCYDQRGLGQSDHPPGDYSMQDYADDAARLMDALNIECLPVMGVSFGGMVAQEFALRHPSRVSCLVLACTSSGGAGGASYPLHDLHHLNPRERAEAHLKVADLRHTQAWIAQNPEKWAKRVELSMAARHPAQGQHPAQESSSSQPDAAGIQEEGSWKQLLARKDHNTFERLPEITVPTLLAGGEFDGIAPPANMQALAAQIVGSQLKFFQGGHMFLIQDKSAYPYIIQWFKDFI